MRRSLIFNTSISWHLTYLTARNTDAHADSERPGPSRSQSPPPTSVRRKRLGQPAHDGAGLAARSGPRRRGPPTVQNLKAASEAGQARLRHQLESRRSESCHMGCGRPNLGHGTAAGQRRPVGPWGLPRWPRGAIRRPARWKGAAFVEFVWTSDLKMSYFQLRCTHY